MNHDREQSSDTALREALRRYWGYAEFRPLQQQAMQAVLESRDSLVVLPTGGGKSLCFQAPAVCLGGLAVVVSPLISLMKDQVDALVACGVPAACVHSGMTTSERRDVAEETRGGRLRLLYVAPERLMQPQTIEFLQSAGVSLIAVDEAHCISQWGHDFRPEYRELSRLRGLFPGIGLHAYTATATETVRGDIISNLQLAAPEVLVGTFDRPNLAYRVLRRHNRLKQIRDVIDRHPGESGIVYCITRNDVMDVSAALTAAGPRALPYHAGLDDETRRRHQEDFIQDRCEIIVATVAFGMGIDKPNVRYVVHAGMPKSIEHYQQESGRAGRDGLSAECCLLYSGGDFLTWKRIIESSNELQGDGAHLSEPPAGPSRQMSPVPLADGREGALQALDAMYNFCGGLRCRHRALSQHFGQTLEGDSCRACDVCLGWLDLVDGAQVIAQKILSSVVRQGERFGGAYTAQVLKGSSDERVLQNGHNRLSTYGLLAEHTLRTIRDWVEQLVDQGHLAAEGEYRVLKVTPSGRQVLRGEQTPKLLKPAERKKRPDRPRSESHEDEWAGVDRELFEALRELRRRLAGERQVPPYIIFGDAALRVMARQRPTTLEAFRQIRGVGEKKLQEFGELFVERIGAWCRQGEAP